MPHSTMGDVRDLRIVVVGAGMGGLGTALAFAKRGFRDISVYENASNLGFVGAGIQMPPNVMRVLHRLGVSAEIEAEATDVKGTSIRKGSTNEELAHVEMPDIREKYGFPHLTGHRSNLAGSLYNGCKKEPAIKFHFATALVKVTSFSPKPTLVFKPRDGPEFQVEADILLASDGIKSVTRTQMLAELGTVSEEEDTGQAAYRIMLTREEMAHDPEMLALLDSDTVVRWVGEKRHIIAYPVSNHNIYNLSSAQPDTHFAAATNATYTTKASKSDMLSVYHDFCPLVHRMLNLVPDGEVCEWKLRIHKPLPTWVHGSVALVGDACHPTLPHLSQGAAMAIEDGAVLAEVVSKIPADKLNDPETITKTLKVYELLRKPHCSALVDLATHSGRVLHLGEGKAKEERDRLFKENGKSGSVPDKWASPDVQKMIYSNDCVKEANEQFERLFATL
ncbi:putative salicylate hydroxylase [Podospora australis]|uniref:Salicylate hydroxylase n=1 Tax=Podospora australis TaxID=1536484 RepID=A0AAN6X504_9PEZI|nr:putative salicylate hydroxylase [Podospora australis]